MKCIAFHCHFDEAKAESLSRASRLEPALTLSAAEGEWGDEGEIPLGPGKLQTELRYSELLENGCRNPVCGSQRFLGHLFTV